ncbi:hypothetical protein Pmar_PMAR020731 [Perkinsus marinus ATCC 50983]|uniref:Uncharacterized protein n=1 Tax=Perkinsus marinus (strain ATCC 50983 / TXsc) TaxID=423536 RepID=C5KIH5_PERM5|nr:hypothetical protein Pmar_PMAR020731 [Perkinsus marinus ATCC 50983]EER15718.1 hypothetical protein Pmar_PMAR020731 [Perkinsus marinus ATCC 50983]|eukprot:XP_002783922.1 hypothetical protein Pmar_PMAR020731 [Perkinsus marinus ATCC 50983]
MDSHKSGPTIELLRLTIKGDMCDGWEGVEVIKNNSRSFCVERYIAGAAEKFTGRCCPRQYDPENS